MLTSFGLHPREMSQVPGRDAAFMEVINQKMLVPERLSVGSGQQWGGEEMGEARGRTKELPPAYSMHIPDRLTYTEAPDMSPKPLFTETKQAVSGLEEPRWGSSSTTREETNVYRESFQSPIKRSYSDQSFGTTSPATPNQLSQAAALPRQLSASRGSGRPVRRSPDPSTGPPPSPPPPSAAPPSLLSPQSVLQAARQLGAQASQRLLQTVNQKYRFNYKEKTAQPSATEVPADHNRRRPVENWSLEEEGGAAVEFIVLRRQVVKMSRRLAALERHNTERRNSELVLFSLLFSACLLNTWLWIRR
ncbi:uncharacterized protein LOC143014438 isoform X1 [Genypterus blacodes]|uniref:uncharacterized protein LOC143014438 isoform X1 n=1 Tax=Genypterus blacodes TaxID=154954 RepID=UPI003F7689D0